MSHHESTLQHPSRPIERKKRSCGECRRRKQKCDQRQPCRNCSRRMPQPICRYEGKRLSLLEVLPHTTAGIGSSPITAACSSWAPTQFWDHNLTSDDGMHPSPSTSYGGSSSGDAWEFGTFFQDKVLDEHTTVNLYSDNFLTFLDQSHTPDTSLVLTDLYQLSSRKVAAKDSVIAARCSAIQGLNQMLAVPELSTSDEAIAAVVRLAFSDLCHGETQGLRVHIDGVREMIRLRGGLTSLVMNGALATIVIIADIATAIALETPPSHLEQERYAFTESISSAASTSTSTSPSTSTAANLLGPPIVAMLKDINFLLDTVHALPAAPSAWQLQKVASVSKWVHGRLLSSEPSVAAKPSFEWRWQSSPPCPRLYSAVRLASLAYCRAVQARKPFSRVVGAEDALGLAEAVGTVPGWMWCCGAGAGGGTGAVAAEPETSNATAALNDDNGSDKRVGGIGDGKGERRGPGGSPGSSNGRNSFMLETLLEVLAVALPTARDMPQCFGARMMLMAAAVQLLGGLGGGCQSVGEGAEVAGLAQWERLCEWECESGVGGVESDRSIECERLSGMAGRFPFHGQTHIN
ncbi:hypothetical protein VTK26DRAFT_7055 [Humicola hyalothermophila]